VDHERIRDYTDRKWDEEIVAALQRYITIPNKSPMFDPDWESHGHMDSAVALIHEWCAAQSIDGLATEIVRLPGRTPLLYCETPGTADATVLLYGHYDKQPEFSGWEPELGPWMPVMRDGKLYGRGGADDGYAAFASLTAIAALRAQGIPHARCVMLIEGCEESGSYDLPHYVDALRDRIGSPELVICLDAECGNYDQLWLTTSLRGLILGTLTADVLTEGVHSGGAGGIVPSSFRIVRSCLDRLEDPVSGGMLDALEVQIPAEHREQARETAATLGDLVVDRFPWAPGARPASDDLVELILNNTWRPSLSITGVAGMPDLASAGNTLRPQTTLKLSMRLPPSLDADEAAKAVRECLEAEPLGQVRFDLEAAETGWHAPALAPWLAQAVDGASRTFFGQPSRMMGCGGTIPFMKMLGDEFPGVQFVVTGVLGPRSNAHGPNEFLHIDTGKRVTACVAAILADHARHARAPRR
jgi:acetylornithine deacetylase/succinyl-diaminopimelate desuccinylase-like protein